MTALIVDDNDLSREALAGLLKRRFPGLKVEIAADGGEAARKAEALRPDLILMDIRLPGGSGLELTSRLKSALPGARIIVQTGHPYPEYRDAAIRHGADGFFVKGGSSRELITLIESLLPASSASS